MEIFNYANVSSAMNNVMTDKANGMQALQSGTQYFEDALTKGGADQAIAGASAEQMKAQWAELTEKFAAFSKYIDQIESLVENASGNNVSLEDVIATNSKAANQ
ncbi:MAG: hypothetical protein ACI4WW_03305 [Candidatus Coprovivens sp.]